MTSAHPYRQGYPSMSTTPSPPHNKQAHQLPRAQYQRDPHSSMAQQYHHHPLRPMDRPYIRTVSSNSSLRDNVPSDITNTYSNAIPLMPSPLFRLNMHSHNSSVSSIDSSGKYAAKAPDTPKGIEPTENNNTDASVNSSPLLLPAASSNLSPTTMNFSSQQLPRPGSNLQDLHSRSASSASVVTSTFDGTSHNMIAQQLGNNSNSLLPKLKTIELYKINAKKSHDPEVLFQYAKYMLNTAIFIDVELDDNDAINSSTISLGSHKKNKSTTSLLLNSNNDASVLNTDTTSVESKKLLKKQFLKEAVHYLRKLSDKGYTEGQYLLADAYSSGALGKPDDKEAFMLFQSAAKHGHVESAYRTSFCYEVGLGTGRDSRKALEFLKFAATKNHPSAMYKMGLYSFYGRMGLSNNINTKKDGIKWLKRASENANELIALAPYELGKIHYEGFRDIIIQDKVYALDLFRLAASLGHIQSLAILAKNYELGDVIPQDADLSIHYYTIAAIGGDPESMLGLCGWFMVGGPNLEKNEVELFEWALKALNAGLPKLQFAVGHFLEKGIGCEQNKDHAYLWFQKLADNGNERAIKKLKGTKFEKKDEKKKWVKKIFA